MFAFTSSVVQSVVCECFNCKLSFCIKLVEIVELSSSVIAVTAFSPVQRAKVQFPSCEDRNID